MSAAYIIGDIHGQYEKLVSLLRGANLVTEDLVWASEDVTLCFVGDFFDRGPDGIGCIELVMRLQQEAAAAGGQVIALLGNHEPLFLAAHRFGVQNMGGEWGELFMANWIRNGGIQRDMERFMPHHLHWIMGLPAMAHVGDCLVIHADSMLYTRHGQTVDDVNANISALLQSPAVMVWDALLFEYSERSAFTNTDGSGVAQARTVLDMFGGRQIIHGHTPISYVTGLSPASITGPMIYADGLCVNVDGGMYLGGPGFVYQMHESTQQVEIQSTLQE